MLEVFAPSSLCVWNEMPWRILKKSVSLSGERTIAFMFL